MVGAAYAANDVPQLHQAMGKTVQNVDRSAFGQYVQARISEAFEGKVPTRYLCGDKPAYYCRGLMVTAFENDATYWMDPTTKKLSFTYAPTPDTGPCAGLGITTAQQGVDKYQNAGPNICGFALNAADGSDRRSMHLMVESAALMQQKGGFLLFPWNEVVLGPWPSYAPGRIPLMAFFSLQSLSTAQMQQKRYYDLTKIFVPIIEISEASPAAVFTYRDENQAAGIPNSVTVFPQ
jgi:hypothetical protein